MSSADDNVNLTFEKKLVKLDDIALVDIGMCYGCEQFNVYELIR